MAAPRVALIFALLVATPAGAIPIMVTIQSIDDQDVVRTESGVYEAVDLDGDGDLDIVINEIDARATILENQSQGLGHWLGVRLEGTSSNRSGIGAVVSLTALGKTQRRRIRSGSSYASQSELIARFGLDSTTEISSLEILWPTGKRELFAVDGVDRVIKVREGDGQKQ